VNECDTGHVVMSYLTCRVWFTLFPGLNSLQEWDCSSGSVMTLDWVWMYA